MWHLLSMGRTMIIWRRIVLSVAAALFGLAANGLAGDESVPRSITWDDLLPKEESPFDDPFEKLSEGQLHDLGTVARIRYLLESEKISVDGPDAQEQKAIVERLGEQGIDVDFLLTQRERVADERRKRAEAVDTSIDGQRVRIPGYMLPLKHSDEGVTEFLLVPWVGACIHTPPPPPNQMVHVAVPGGVEDKGRFAAIWIEGEIALQPGSYELFLVDGKREINVAYTMSTGVISEYSTVESDVLSKVEVPEAMTAEHSWWQRWQTKVSLLFTKTMTDIKDRQSSWPLFTGLFVAFLYGVVHTLGPGHGKAVVIAYFVGERGSLWRGVKMGGQIALFHVLSAVIVVLITDFAVRQATGSAPSDYRMVRLISYASIIAIGFWMMVKAILAARASRYHDHEHHEGCGCSQLAKPAKGVGGLLSLAVGAVPCTGALLVLLFGLANDLLWPSVVLVVAISAGMALALSGVGIAAILGRRFLDRRVGDDAARQHKVAAGLRIAAAAAVLCVGCVLFGLTWSGGVAPKSMQVKQETGTGPNVDSSPSCFVVLAIQSALPYGAPRTQLRRIASSSASEAGSFTYANHLRGLAIGHFERSRDLRPTLTCFGKGETR